MIAFIPVFSNQALVVHMGAAHMDLFSKHNQIFGTSDSSSVNHNGALLSPMSGKSVDLNTVKDPIFSEKLLGDGVAIVPFSPVVVSPAYGVISQVAHTHHAVGITTDDGLELLIHCGLNTVKLAGNGFEVFVSEGQRVSAGQKIMTFDIDYVASNGCDITSPCIITNSSMLKDIKVLFGEVEAGVSKFIFYSKKS